MSRLRGVAVAVATAFVIVAVAILPFLTPAWMAFAQERAEVTAWTGWSEADVRTATDAIVADLVFGGEFDVAVQQMSVLVERERSHMRDVQDVFRGFYGLAAAALVGLALVVARRRGSADAAWRSIRSGGIVLAGALVAGALVVAVAFDAAFAVFHGLFFAAGSWTFDPRTDRLVQLFPERLWIETTVGVGAVALVVGLLVAGFAARRIVERGA